MKNFTQNYEKILETLQLVESKMNFLNQKCKPNLSDIELIAIDLTSEYMSIDSERDLFRKLPSLMTSKIERSVYNRRKRRLFCHRELLRKKLAHCIGTHDCYIVDKDLCKTSLSSIHIIFLFYLAIFYSLSDIWSHYFRIFPRNTSQEASPLPLNSLF